MSLISSLLKKFRPLEVDDPFFGLITYMKMPRGRISYWEATRLFKPSNREIELFIDAPAAELPPNELQRQFFTSVEVRFKEVLKAVELVLRPQFEEWTRKPLCESFEVEFTMTSFSIPCASLEHAEWEISFESKSDANHLFSVSLIGLVAKGVSIDG
ncbi:MULTISPECIES: hypothetical protein [Methylomonas]|uniref:Uncharacterized protein n=1 Tax=Methylomonas koyamae TaxID=702114 RepID=A0A177NM47_9GAMM|nr:MULTISPECIES: hypothetical protein [Methylomonas]OAI19158.1 hypothetical protein A1355_04760 [Methylomonas koyamae]OHX38178.1 hypothetical protein BJL95_23525 [Methylomonas sp. LWB]